MPTTSSKEQVPSWLADILTGQAQQLQLLQQLVTTLMDQKAIQVTASAPASVVYDPYGDLIQDLPTFSYDKDDDATFDAWYKRYKPVIDDREATLSDERKRNLIIDKLDQAAYRTYSDHMLPLKSGDVDLVTTIQNLKQLFGPKQTLIRRRFEFLQTTCPPLSYSNIPYRDFGNAIKKKFEDALMKDVDGDSLKCLVFVAGLTDPSHSEMRLRLLNYFNRMKEGEPSPTLDDFINECETFVTLRSENSTMEHKDVNATFKKKFSRKKQRSSRSIPFRKRRPVDQRSDQESSYNEKAESTCWHRNRSNRQKCHCKSVALLSDNARTYLKVRINEKFIRLQLDTGADITMISSSTWKTIGAPPIVNTAIPVKTADGSPMKILGRFDADFTVFDRHQRPTNGHGTCYVTESTDLLGLEWCMQMPEYRQLKEHYHCRMTTRELENIRNNTLFELKAKFPDVFSPGLGHCTKTKAKLFLRSDARPVYKQKRPLPFASQSAVDAEIDRLLKDKVLSAVDHSNWAAPIVVVRKSNGNVRICADFSTGLNDALLSHQHPLPVIADIFSKLNGGQLFSKVDLADAYLQIEMDESSKELLTINTHRGLFRYNRLPFGVKCAPGIFQQVIDSLTSGLPGVAAYLDDIVVTGSTSDEHRRNLEALFGRISSYGFRIRADKCHFMMTEIKYLGNIIDKDGRRPDPEKTRAIIEMPPPKNISQLRSLLGMINYYGAFIEDMLLLRAPLNALLKKDVPFVWSTDCQKAFERAKEILTLPLLLTHYDTSLDLIVAADASEYGVGAVLLHRFPDGAEKAISHASRSLTDAEKKYGQIEKEGLALVYAVRKFHRYLLGRTFTLLTDHKPLVAIFGSRNGLPSHTANRLLRWSIILRAYDFKIQYRKTTEFGHADALSRLIPEGATPAEDVVIAEAAKDVDACCRAVMAKFPITIETIAEESAADKVIKDVMYHVKWNKWPNRPSPDISRYQAIRHSLSIQYDCLFFGSRVVIPLKLRQQVLRLLHDGHPGATRMKMLARSYAYWTNITRDIEDYVQNCQDCQEVAKAPVKSELFSWPTEKQPWCPIHIDYAGPFNGRMFLVIVDAYSKWPEIIEMPSTSSKATIRELMKLFAQFGNPEVIVSDNGSQFTSAEFTDFCRTNGIEHVRSPPYHPQSNGQAERFVDTFKRAMQKLQGSQTTTSALQKFLFVYRRTPCSSSPGGRSPAENFLGRHIRSTLSLLSTPRMTQHTRNAAMEHQFNRHNGARKKAFIPGDMVWVQDFRPGQRWTSGNVLSRQGSALYEVLVEGSVHRRHANQLRPQGKSSYVKTLYDFFDIPNGNLKHSAANRNATAPTSTMVHEDLTDSATPTTTSTSVPSIQRNRQQPDRLQVNPSLKSYV